MVTGRTSYDLLVAEEQHRLIRPQQKLSFASINYTQMEMRIAAEYAKALKKRRFARLSSFLAQKLL